MENVNPPLDDSSLDKEYERLNDAIMKAMVASPEIKNILLDFKSRKMINHLAVLNLILSMEELYDLVFSDPNGAEDFKLSPC